MSDLTSGRYPDTYEEWLLDGKPAQPYRTTISRKDIVSSGTSNGILLASATVYVYAVIVQQGDVLGAVNVLVGNSTATGTHGWAALYTGVGATSTLIAQSSDLTTGFTAGAQKFALSSAYTVGNQTPGATGTDGPIVLGVALYNSGATGGRLDGMTSSSVAGSVAISGQSALVSSFSLAATATAPSVLTGAVALAGGVPYIALSRS